MIWIATVFLLFVVAWLFINGLNEKRWVESHSHDETVASDQGLFAGLGARTPIASNDEKLSIDQENTRFARTASKLKNKTTRMGSLIESNVQKAREAGSKQRGAAISAEPSSLERGAASVNLGARHPDQKLGGNLVQQSTQQVAGASSPMANSDGVFDQMIRKVSGKLEDKQSLRD